MECPVPQNFIKVTKSWPLFPHIFKWLIWKWFSLLVCLDVVPKYEVGGTQEYWELFPVATPPSVQVPVVTPLPIWSFRACLEFQRSQVILHPSNCPVFLAPSLFHCFIDAISLYLNLYCRFLITHNKVEALRRQSWGNWLWEYTQPGMLCSLCSFHKCLLSGWEASYRHRDFVSPCSYHVHCFLLLFILLLRAI